MSLHELSSKYGTNKTWHGYTSFYSKLFDPVKDKVTNFLEIGIDQGAPILAWKDYFENATIYGIDLAIPDAVKDVPRVQYAIADQSKADQLRTVVNQWGNPMFDGILDDGGHTVKQQRVSIETLWAFVKPGGWYIVEDLHTNIRALYRIHPHLRGGNWIDESPTMHEKIMNIMAGSTSEFSFPVSQIEEILYFNTPNKLSLTCALKKAAVI